jgi:serine protease AprX
LRGTAVAVLIFIREHDVIVRAVMSGREKHHDVPPIATEVAMSNQRYKVRFPSQDAFWAAQAVETAPYPTPVINAERRTISIEVPSGDFSAESFDTSLNLMREKYGAQIVPDFQFDLDRASDVFEPETVAVEDVNSPSLPDVIEMINAPAAWNETRGSGVTIAIVDTGINGARPEFPVTRRSPFGWSPTGLSAWEDANGHGTMCATIAAATDVQGGEFVGVAPEATLMSCRTDFFDTELTAIYQLLRDRALAGEIVVASNSFGLNTGNPPPPPDVDFVDAMREAIEAGVIVVFSAGNNHELANGAAKACGPTSIWAHKTLSTVLTVATCKLDRTMWEYSSRGPGQFHAEPGHERKPDVTAPTPANGRILFGATVRTLTRGWGTSGACPQVAGLTALLRSKRPDLTRAQLQDAIRKTAASLGVAGGCGGRGLIDCGAAIGMI